MKYPLFAACLLLALPVCAQTVKTNFENITPDSRYTVHNDGTVTDNDTGLMWIQCSEGQIWESNGGAEDCTGTATTYTWDAAMTLANDKSFAGYSDWRLPNIKELASLVAGDRSGPAINSKIFPETPWSYFWSGSPKAYNSGSSWIVEFHYGYGGDYDRGNDSHVRLVRSVP